MTDPKTINVEPDYDGLRAWLKNVAKTDLNLALHINSTLGSEGFPEETLEAINEGREWKG